MAGRFIVFDGPDGSGKSTQFRRFSAMLQSAGIITCEVREPGGTAIGERIREILLDPACTEMDMRCEMLLYMASRAQLMSQRIIPALQARQCVLADRFISSTLAYQGTAGGLDTASIMEVGRIAIADRWPDLVVVFDVDEDTAASRLSPLLDRIEARGRDYHRRVRSGFLDQAAANPEGYLVVDASQEPERVYESLLLGVRSHIERQTTALGNGDQRPGGSGR